MKVPAKEGGDSILPDFIARLALTGKNVCHGVILPFRPADSKFAGLKSIAIGIDP